jgi:hypothetical protein
VRAGIVDHAAQLLIHPPQRLLELLIAAIKLSFAPLDRADQVRVPPLKRGGRGRRDDAKLAAWRSPIIRPQPAG